jgi:hypothetical protein
VILDSIARIMSDFVMLHLDPQKVKAAWTDEHKLIRCPYLRGRDEEDEEGADGEDGGQGGQEKFYDEYGNEIAV